MVKVIKAEEGIGIGFSSASEFLSVMDFIQELAMFAKEAFKDGECEYSDASSVEELIGQLCLIQLAETSKRIDANPDMLEELKIAAAMEHNDSHAKKDYNDAMYG